MAGISFQPNVNNIGYGTLDPSQGKVLDRHLTAPPVSPVVGARYIVAAVATGAWAGKEKYIAEYSSGLSWDFTAPTEGMTCWIDDENVLFFYDGSAWDLADKQFDHGSLKGLTDDDHTDYLTSGRADTWLTGKTQDNLADGTNYKQFSAAQKIALTGITTTRGEPTGFENRTDSTFSYNNTTKKLTLTGTYNVWVNGIKFTKTNDEITVTATKGLHYIYYNASGVLSQDIDFPGFSSALVATVYYDDNTSGKVGDERHGIIMDSKTHEVLHNVIKTSYGSGLTGTFGNDSFTITAGTIYDEDIEISIPETTQAYKWARKQYSTVFTTYAKSAYPYYLSLGNLHYDNAGVLTPLGSNEYVATWVFATNDISEPIILMIGQRKDTTLAAARANNTYESLSFATLPFKEMKLLYRVIFRNDATPYEETQDYRSVSTVPAGTYVATNHGVLTGLTNDDHTQYHNDTRGDARYYQQSEFMASSAGATDAGKPIKLDTAGKIDSSMIPSSVGGGVQVIELAFGGTSAYYDSTTEIPENALVLWARIYYRNVGYNSHATAVNVGYDGDTDFIFSDAELDAIDETDEYTYRDLDSYKKDYALPLTWSASEKNLRVTITDSHFTATGLVGYVWLAYVEKKA